MKLYNTLKNATLEEYTTPCAIVVDINSRWSEVAKIMEANNIRHVPVRDEGELVGVVSDRDLKVAFRLDTEGKDGVVGDIMSHDPYVVSEGSTLEDVVYYMSAHKIGSALVQQSDGDIGIFTSTDALNALVELLRSQGNDE